MKKLISFIFAMLLMSVFVACGGSDDKDTPKKPEVVEPKEICVPAPGEIC